MADAIDTPDGYRRQQSDYALAMDWMRFTGRAPFGVSRAEMERELVEADRAFFAAFEGKA